MTGVVEKSRFSPSQGAYLNNTHDNALPLPLRPCFLSRSNDCQATIEFTRFSLFFKGRQIRCMRVIVQVKSINVYIYVLENIFATKVQT